MIGGISFLPMENEEKNLKSIGVRDEMGGQGQYRVGRGRIGWAGVVSAVPLPKVRLSAF